MTDGISYNAVQLQAIRHGEGPMLVIAGPGSGKTAVITGRTARLIREGVSPSSVLVVTFTRAAAAEMKERFLQVTGRKTTEVTFGTFHSIFYGILRRHFGRMEVISEQEKAELLKDIVRWALPEAEQETDLPQQVIREISQFKGLDADISKYYAASLPQEAFRSVFREYERWKQQRGMIDFDDIILRARDLLLKNPDILSAWQERFVWILIDEFQDISPLQYEVIRMLAAPQDNLFIVGDDDQSIYRFRGASPGIMLQFPRDYPSASMIILDENYRSTPEILTAAGKLIRRNERRYRKQIYTRRRSGDAVCLEQFRNPGQECRYLAEQIRKQYREGIPYEEMAILVRTNALCREPVEQLMALQIPFQVRDRVSCIYDHWIAKDLAAYMELGAGRRSRDCFLQICNRPNRYLSRQAFEDPEVSFASLHSWYEDKPWMRERLRQLEADLQMIGSLPPYGAVTYIRRSTGYDDFLREYAARRGIPEEELFEIADELTESARNHRTWKEWRSWMEAYRESLRRNSGIPGTGQEKDSGVTISTLHAAKGMEYDSVFILDVNEGIIPWRKAGTAADLEEERRLLYVGMTRARKRLRLLAVRERHEKPAELSRFIRDMQ